MQTRRARTQDAAIVTELLRQLGYPRTVDDVAARLDADASSVVDPAWVAGEADGPVGLVTGHLSRPYELDRPVAEITALVVLEGRRSAGVGSALVAELEAWAIEQGACRISVASSLRREDAHAFYGSLGYAQRAKKLEKQISA